MSDNIDLKLLGRRLETIQSELREIKFSIALERDRFDRLSQVLGQQLGDVEAKLTSRLDSLETLINERYNYAEIQFGDVKTRLDRIEAQNNHGAERIDHLIALVEQMSKRE